EAALTSLRRLEQIARALVTQDAVAYEAMTTASKRRGESDGAAGVYQEAVLAAVAVPMEIAAVASRTLTTMDEMKEIANRYLLSDLAIAAVLAEATARSARYLVQLNAAELTDKGRQTAVLAEVDQTVQHCDTTREAIEAFVCDQLEIEPAGNR
ncbi:MAG: cyclodeaminase/cyclohydrolase family protein, partial [Planctomycetes bacterium]|nr:cyclodeaminase/cyclohydrolase family protein [Planctomycetota bacterium]